LLPNNFFRYKFIKNCQKYKPIHVNIIKKINKIVKKDIIFLNKNMKINSLNNEDFLDNKFKKKKKDFFIKLIFLSQKKKNKKYYVYTNIPFKSKIG
jgi:hypothetical protein